MWCKACLDEKPLLDGTPYCASCTKMRMENQIREEVEKRQAPVRWNERNECIIDGEVWSVNKNLQTVKLRKAGGALLSDTTNGSNDKPKLVEKGNEKMGAMKELAIKNGQKGKGGTMATKTKKTEDVEKILAQGTIVEVEPIGGPAAETKTEAPATVTVEVPKPAEAKKEEKTETVIAGERFNTEAFIKAIGAHGHNEDASRLEAIVDSNEKRCEVASFLVKSGLMEKVWPHYNTEHGKKVVQVKLDWLEANRKEHNK